MPDMDELYTVIVQEPAAEMLVQHARFLTQVSVKAANRLLAEFKKQTASLETTPERCPWLYHPMVQERKYRKLIFEKQYMLIFQIVGKKVFVDAMVDCRQDYIYLL